MSLENINAPQLSNPICWFALIVSGNAGGLKFSSANNLESCTVTADVPLCVTGCAIEIILPNSKANKTIIFFILLV
jgi:hypothetical protein